LARQAVADMADTPAGRIASSSIAAQQALAARLGPAAVFALPLVLPGACHLVQQISFFA